MNNNFYYNISGKIVIDRKGTGVNVTNLIQNKSFLEIRWSYALKLLSAQKISPPDFLNYFSITRSIWQLGLNFQFQNPVSKG